MFRPLQIPGYIKKHLNEHESFLADLENIRQKVRTLRGNPDEAPLVTVVIPAYNEEKTILRTIASLADTRTEKNVEILVVDNKSTDRTREFVQQTGVEYAFEGKQGVKNARTHGLNKAKGTYIINADADTIYSPYWVDHLVDPLIRNKDIACSYGRFSFIPETGYNRFEFFLYELLGDSFKRVNGKLKDEAMYVYGCSSAYRKEQAIAVNGYEHPPGSNEDGYLGLKLRNKFGKLRQERSVDSLAWTSSRRFIADGTLTNRILKKIKNLVKPNNA